MLKNILGMEKIYDVIPNFMWSNIISIEEIKYFIELDEYQEKVSSLEILFGVVIDNDTLGILLVNFKNVNKLKLDNIGGKYNQVMGLEIIDHLAQGWECEQRYTVRDYENGTVEFFCESIEIVSI